jgi:hypothetical protein
MRLFLLIFLFLTSCQSRHYQDHHIKSSYTLEEAKGIAVLKVDGRKSMIGTRAQVSFDLSRVRDAAGNRTIERLSYRVKPGIFSFGEADREVLRLEPGLYIIDNIEWKWGNTRYYTGEDSLFSTCPVAFGAFEVLPGSVVYVGDFVVTNTDQNVISIERTDRFFDAKADLGQRYPKLADALSETTFYPGGACIPPVMPSSH